MKFTLTKLILTSTAFLAFAIFTPLALAQEDTTQGKPTVGGQMKEAGKETGKAAKSLSSNVRKGRIARGGKHFGKHLGHAGKNVGRGTKKAAIKTADKTEDVVEASADTTKDLAKNTAHTTKSVVKKTASVTKRATKKTVKAVKKAVNPNDSNS
ncbi:MAG: hypothetical protein HY231_12675 [Acidobacteria bacterium]|nr:hypothetical protein [Acidobacteriota bacterium]